MSALKLVPSSSEPDELRRAIEEHVSWFERAQQAAERVEQRVTRLERDVAESARNDRLVLAKLDEISEQLIEIRTARKVVNKVLAVFAAAASLFIAARAAGIF